MNDHILESKTIRGFPCHVVHNGFGYRCGYLSVPEGHPWYEVHYDKIDTDVHGGLTYSAETKDGWKVGFDCAHWMDAQDPELMTDEIPKMDIFGRDGEVRTTEYVLNELERLAEQAEKATDEATDE